MADRPGPPAAPRRRRPGRGGPPPPRRLARRDGGTHLRGRFSWGKRTGATMTTTVSLSPVQETGTESLSPVQETGSGAWQQAGNVLCVRLDALGDVLMTTPALRALKHGRPGRRLTLLTSPAAAELTPLVPEIDECIVYDAPWMKATALRVNSEPEFAMIERLRRG